MIKFFKNAFSDMKESAKAQHEVDKANFAAEKAEAKARHKEAVAMSKKSTRQKLDRERRDAAIAEANARREAAEERIRELEDGSAEKSE